MEGGLAVVARARFQKFDKVFGRHPRVVAQAFLPGILACVVFTGLGTKTTKARMPVLQNRAIPSRPSKLQDAEKCRDRPGGRPGTSRRRLRGNVCAACR